MGTRDEALRVNTEIENFKLRLGMSKLNLLDGKPAVQSTHKK